MEICAENIGGVWFGVACVGQRVLATSFGSDEMKVLESLHESVKLSVDFQVPTGSSTFAQKVLRALRDVYDGKDVSIDAHLDLERMPAYTQRVLRTVSHIPLGYVASYGGVAEAAGGGARAVGNVMANNPFAPIVPCHRVVTSSLGLGGYGGGLKEKFEFLKREGRGFPEKQEILVGGGVLRIFPVEFVLRKLEILTYRKSHIGSSLVSQKKL